MTRIKLIVPLSCWIKQTKTLHFMPLYTSCMKHLVLLILPCICFTLNEHPSLLGHSRQQVVMCYFFFCLKNNYLTLLLLSVFNTILCSPLLQILKELSKNQSKQVFFPLPYGNHSLQGHHWPPLLNPVVSFQSSSYLIYQLHLTQVIHFSLKYFFLRIQWALNSHFPSTSLMVLSQLTLFIPCLCNLLTWGCSQLHACPLSLHNYVLADYSQYQALKKIYMLKGLDLFQPPDLIFNSLLHISIWKSYRHSISTCQSSSHPNHHHNLLHSATFPSQMMTHTPFHLLATKIFPTQSSRISYLIWGKIFVLS